MDERREHPRRDQLTEAEAARVADVFTTHHRFLEHVARQHAPSPDHVPDIVQAVGIQVCRGLNSFRDEANLTTWLYRVTVNTARTYYRREKRHLLAVEAATNYPDPDTVLDPDDQLVEGRRRAALSEALDRMKPLHQQLIREELAGAGVLSCRKSSRHRARRQLRQLLADDPRLGTE